MAASGEPAVSQLILVFPMLLIFVVFMNRYILGLFLLKLRTTTQRQVTNGFSRASVCVIVPLYNEGKSVAKTVCSICQQNYPAELLSIIVVDDCSTDDSYQWAREAAAKENHDVRVIQNPVNMGKRLGIARAVRMTEAEFIVSVDSDVELAKDAIELLIGEFDSPKVAAVGGRVLVSNAQKNWLTKMQTIKYYVGYSFLKNLERAFDSVLCLSGCLTAYRRHVLEELEPVLLDRNMMSVPIKYGEDRFLTRQIVKHGYKTKLNLAAHCYTKAPVSLGNYFSQQLRWRRSNIVDFLGSFSHFWRLPPLVALNYLTLNALILCYPFILWLSIWKGRFWTGFGVHVGCLTILACCYWVNSRRTNSRAHQVHPVHFLWMALVMPVTYMVLTILALFTLDSGSWETRRTAENA